MSDLEKDKAKMLHALELAVAITDTIREAGQVPESYLFAPLQGTMSLNSFNALLGLLKTGKLIKIENHLITWIGPVAEGGGPPRSERPNDKEKTDTGGQ